MTLDAVAELLQERIGVDPLSLGATVLSSIVARRMRALGLTVPQHYAAHLTNSAEEFAALIEDVVVAETWFFRGGNVFSYLGDHVRREITTASPTSMFRILSAPCSSGEEPYSMAIALMEAGIPCERWTIKGVDLSPRTLARARHGVYRESSFRETPARLQRKYFHASNAGWKLDPALRDLVCFQQGNLLDPGLFQGAATFDLIFCRNVLIYLHAEARSCVLANLDRLLAPSGLLCMGHAEPLSLLDPRFQATGPHDSFLFQRRQRTGETPVRPAPVALPDGTGETPIPRKKRPLRSGSRRRPLPVPCVPSSSIAPGDRLLQARQEADSGALDKALQTCQAHFSVAEPSASAYSLLGVIHQARQDKTKAAECFRRALYLDPQHEEALLHLMLLSQEGGNEAEAMRLRQRLGRKTAGGEA